MNSIDDGRLRAHLERRSAPGLDPGRAGAIADGARAAASAVETGRWVVFARRFGPAVGALGLIALFGAIALFAPSTGGGPGSSARPAGLTVLTGAQLTQLLASPSDPPMDRIVVADVDIQPAAIRGCATFGRCPSFLVVGTNRVVYDDSEPAYVDDVDLAGTDPYAVIGGPVALRVLANGQLELIGRVETLPGGQVVWPVGSALTELERWQLASIADTGSDGIAVGPLFVVDAWLVEALAPGCPAPPQEQVPGTEGFWCGAAAWLTPAAIQPTTVVSDGDSSSISTVTPRGSIRVQNFVYERHAPNPTRSGSHLVAEPRQGLYLVRSILAFPDECFACDADGQAFLIARLDPVEVP